MDLFYTLRPINRLLKEINSCSFCNLSVKICAYNLSIIWLRTGIIQSWLENELEPRSNWKTGQIIYLFFCFCSWQWTTLLQFFLSLTAVSCTHTNTHTHTLALPISLPLPLSLTHTHSLSLSLSLLTRGVWKMEALGDFTSVKLKPILKYGLSTQ